MKKAFGDPWLWAGCALYAIALTWLGWVKYQTHHNLVDFGIFAQTAASAFGCFCNGPEGSHWAFHFSPLLYVPGALLLIWKSPLVMIALPAIACALAAPPVYAIVRTRTDVATARLAGLVALLYPPLAGLAFVDFHENAFAPAAIAWLLWAFDAGYLGIAAIAAMVALAVKEDQAVFLTVAGGAGAWLYRTDKRRSRFALGVAIAGVAVVVAFFAFIQPHANGSPDWQPNRFYAWSSDDLRGLPFGIIQRLGFLVLAFAPLIFVPFRSKWMWLVALPLAEVLLSRMSTTFTMGTHYAGAWAGYVLIAFAFGVAALPKPRRTLWWALGLTVVVFVAANPLHPGLNLRAIEPRDITLDRYLANLPANAAVTTQEEIYTHLALSDPQATVLPDRTSQPAATCDILIDLDYPESPRLEEYWAALRSRYEMRMDGTGIERHSCMGADVAPPPIWEAQTAVAALISKAPVVDVFVDSFVPVRYRYYDDLVKAGVLQRYATEGLTVARFRLSPQGRALATKQRWRLLRGVVLIPVGTLRLVRVAVHVSARASVLPEQPVFWATYSFVGVPNSVGKSLLAFGPAVDWVLGRVYPLGCKTTLATITRERTERASLIRPYGTLFATFARSWGTPLAPSDCSADEKPGLQ